MTSDLITRLSKLDAPDREAELLRLYQEEKQRADGMSDDWVDFCNYIAIDLDTQEAVAEAINVARHNDHDEREEMKARIAELEDGIQYASAWLALSFPNAAVKLIADLDALLRAKEASKP